MMQQEAVPEKPPQMLFEMLLDLDKTYKLKSDSHPLWPTVDKPSPEEPQAKRSRLMGEYKLVDSSSSATPKKDPRWKDRQRRSGYKPHAYGRALQEEGFENHLSHGVFGVVNSETRHWVQLV
jgi:hypothetical protein